MTRANWRVGMAVLLGLLVWYNALPQEAIEASYPACKQAFTDNHFVVGSLPSATMQSYHCSASAGVAYDIMFLYNSASGSPLPGNAGGMLNVKLYLLNGGTYQWLADSAPQPSGEQIGRTPISNETWYIQVENLGPNSNYDASVDAWIPGGCAGCVQPTRVAPTATPSSAPESESGQPPTPSPDSGIGTGQSGMGTSLGSPPPCRAVHDIHLYLPYPHTLAAGSEDTFTCTVVGGKTYQVVLDYDLLGATPGDAGSYVGIKLFDTKDGAHLGDSQADGYKRETVTRTADANGVWMIKVENLASAPEYSMGVDAWIPGGCAGCGLPPPPGPF